MGDVGRGFYTPVEVQNYFKHHIQPYFDFLFPNHFELSFLADKKIDSLDLAIKAARGLCNKSNQSVIVTSLLLSDKPGIHTLLVTAKEGALVSTPYLEINHNLAGSGDLFHALFLGHHLNGKSLIESLELAVSGIYQVIKKTQQANTYELQIIENQTQLLEPSELFTAQRIESSSARASL